MTAKPKSVSVRAVRLGISREPAFVAQAPVAQSAIRARPFATAAGLRLLDNLRCMTNIFWPYALYLCSQQAEWLAINFTCMKKTTAFSSLLLLGGLGSLSYLAAQLADLNLTFDLRGEDACHYC